MNPSVKTAMWRTLVLFVWVFGGSWIFVLIENKNEDVSKKSKNKEQMLAELFRNISSKYNITLAEFKYLTFTVHRALTVPKRQWSYYSSVEFALHTVTTIGYGYLTPTTPTGQIVCVFYALIGIPITMLTLKSVGGLIAEGFKTIIRKAEKVCFKTEDIKYIETKCIVVTCVAILLYLVLGAILQMYADNLTFIQGIYMWFIACTTIGYGDYYPGVSLDRPVDESNPSAFNQDIDTIAVLFIEISGCIFYLLGLCLMSAVLNAIAAKIETQRFKPRARLFLSRYQKSVNLENCSNTVGEEKSTKNGFHRDSVFKHKNIHEEIELKTVSHI